MVNDRHSRRARKVLVWAAMATILSLPAGVICSGQSQRPEGQVGHLLSRGVKLAEQGQFAEAALILEHARTVAPRDTDVLTVLAEVKGKSGERESAVSLLRDVVGLTPRSAEAHANLAIALADDEHPNSALHEASEAIHLKPELASAHLTKARLLVGLRRPSEAASEFAVACRLAPNSPSAYYYWALMERDEGNVMKEASLLQIVVRLQPQNYVAFYLLGCSLSDQSKEQEAVAAWRRATAIAPNYSAAIYQLWRSLRRMHSPEARQLRQQFFAIRDHENTLQKARSLGNHAYIEMQAQNWSAAIPLLRKALSLCGGCTMEASLHKDLGLALYRNGDRQEGQTQLSIALKLNPDDLGTARALAILAHHEKLHSPMSR